MRFLLKNIKWLINIRRRIKKRKKKNYKLLKMLQNGCIIIKLSQDNYMKICPQNIKNIKFHKENIHLESQTLLDILLKV